MRNIILIIDGGKFRRDFENVARKNNYWTQAIYPQDFKRHFNKVITPVLSIFSNRVDFDVDSVIDVEYEYVRSKLEWMGKNFRDDKTGFCLVISGLSEKSWVGVKEDFGAFSFRDISGEKSVEEIFNILSGKKGE